MFTEQPFHSVETTVEHHIATMPPADTCLAPGGEADPYAVIEFLLKKIEEQQVRIGEQDAYQELLGTEIDTLKGQVEASRQELDQQLADYEVLMQNTLSQEQELESLRQAVRDHQQKQAQPRIQLPFHTTQRLANLGFDNQQSHRVAV